MARNSRNRALSVSMPDFIIAEELKRNLLPCDHEMISSVRLIISTWGGNGESVLLVTSYMEKAREHYEQNHLVEEVRNRHPSQIC